MIIPSDPFELGALLGRRLDGAQGYLARYDQYFEGNQPSAFMSPESLAAMNGRLPMLSVNVARLTVLSLAERLRVIGFRVDGASDPDPDLWASWTRCGMDVGQDMAHVDALISGRSYVIAWADEYGDPLLTPASARFCTTITDPNTRRVLAGMHRFYVQPDPDQPMGQAFAVIFTGQRVITMTTAEDQPISGYPPMGAAWKIIESLPNPLGVVPVVNVLNGYGRRILTSLEGESELADLMPLTDAIAKLGQDMMVTSEVSARPRRWATGLELVPQRDPVTGADVLDEDGQQVFVNPFSSDALRVWQSESPETTFGQFPQADLAPYTSAITTLMGQVGAVSTLPAHYLGIHGDQPPSADSIRAAEASLTSRALGKIRMFTQPWGWVGALEIGIRTGRDPRTIAVEPMWASAETRTPSQDADEAAKLGALGVPLTSVLREVLGWTPEQLNGLRQDRMVDQLDKLVAAPPAQPVPPGEAGAA